MKTIQHFSSFNFRRYGNPWVAIVDPKTAKPDFEKKVGGYTGGYNRGEEGDLYVTNPQEGAVYMYGQKDYRGGNTERAYVQYVGGEFVPVEAANLVETLAQVEAEPKVEEQETAKPAEMTGSEKQVAWATEIRARVLEVLRAALEMQKQVAPANTANLKVWEQLIDVTEKFDGRAGDMIELLKDYRTTGDTRKDAAELVSTIRAFRISRDLCAYGVQMLKALGIEY